MVWKPVKNYASFHDSFMCLLMYIEHHLVFKIQRILQRLWIFTHHCQPQVPSRGSSSQWRSRASGTNPRVQTIDSLLTKAHDPYKRQFAALQEHAIGRNRLIACTINCSWVADWNILYNTCRPVKDTWSRAKEVKEHFQKRKQKEKVYFTVFIIMINTAVKASTTLQWWQGHIAA